ncbi:phosphatase PAP2 family protein [Phenylobacterium sp.]|uniref:acid phosphatase n=1 Tax=Phenylobacterium sp. TaxID=1871053 RepID=UPI0025DD0BC9|nr:phosphatase PAP2 family protein [Phenylobacterium sp.]MBX3483897.1 phosphatase PAP2 family protein [Phenylobacterium sp.]MCW5761261.1 phosphatase PAP2 family protein [Phenylobacterium sp.]
MIRPLALAATLALLSAGATTADALQGDGKDASMGPVPTRLVGYLKDGVLNGVEILGPPPAADSPHGRADRTVFEETRALEGTARWKTAQQDNDLWGGGAVKRFSCAMGVELSERTTPVTSRMLHRVELDVRTVGSPAKAAYDRKRPLIGNDAPLCVPREDWMKTNASYPSGHAMTAWSWALLLTELKPDRATALLETGKAGGDSRVVCGVHFPSDVEAGRTLGAAMMARLHADAAFQSDLRKAKREIARTKAQPAGCEG